MNPIEKAKMVAYWFHRDQKDQAGQPYVGHLERVAAPMYPSETMVQIAWLHDVVEDTTCTIADLVHLGFHPDVVRGVEAITQLPGEPLEDYWARVKANPYARTVKVKGDIPDNLDERRLDYLPPHLQDKLRAKYARALEFLGDGTA